MLEECRMGSRHRLCSLVFHVLGYLRRGLLSPDRRSSVVLASLHDLEKGYGVAMEIQLTMKTGLKGAEMSGAWIATVYNDVGSVSFQEKAITATGALTALERKVQEVLNAIGEMKPRPSANRR